MFLVYKYFMRPKKHPSELRDIAFHLRLTLDEKRQFYAQAKTHRMELGSYLRSLAVNEGERLLADGRIRHGSEGKWEVFLMGEWCVVHT